MNDFIQTLNQSVRLSPESQKALVEILKPFDLPKGHLLLKEHTTCNYIYYLERGLTRTFYFKEGKDVTDWISPEKTFACSIVSYITRRPDIRNIELLENSLLWGMHYNDIEQLCQKYHEIEHFGRLLVSDGLVQLQHRFDDLHFATASERYKKLMVTNPGIIQRVPLGMIASYLGITQETLSRIRAQHF
jgi:CRP-like cAMP-binding protein